MGFFQSLKQDLSEAVGELIGEDETPEGVENTEGIDDAAEAVAADIDAEDVDYDPEDIEEMTEEQFSKLRTNFNLPHLGKLSCNYKRWSGVKKKFKILTNRVHNPTPKYRSKNSTIKKNSCITSD